MDLGYNEEAKKYFEIATSKNNINAYIYLGKLYFDEGKYEEAKRYFEIPANDANAYSEHMLGLI